jgi:hypothetical protein
MRSESQTIAYNSLGHAYFSPLLVMQKTNLPAYSQKQLDELKRTFPSPGELAQIDLLECLLVPMPAVEVSIHKLRQTFPECFYRSSNPWYLEMAETFAYDEVSPVATWMAIRRCRVTEAKSQSYSAQTKAIRGFGLEPAPAVAVLYAVFLYFCIRGIKLFNATELRTASRTSKDECVTVGPFGKDGFPIKRSGDRERTPSLNIAVMYPLKEK